VSAILPQHGGKGNGDNFIFQGLNLPRAVSFAEFEQGRLVFGFIFQRAVGERSFDISKRNSDISGTFDITKSFMTAPSGVVSL
jgi:hypothetical protein